MENIHDFELSYIPEPQYPKYIAVPFDEYKKLIELSSQAELTCKILEKLLNKENKNE